LLIFYGALKKAPFHRVLLSHLPPDKGDYHYTLYSRTAKKKEGKILPVKRDQVKTQIQVLGLFT